MLFLFVFIIVIIIVIRNIVLFFFVFKIIIVIIFNIRNSGFEVIIYIVIDNDVRVKYL